MLLLMNNFLSGAHVDAAFRHFQNLSKPIRQILSNSIESQGGNPMESSKSQGLRWAGYGLSKVMVGWNSRESCSFISFVGGFFVFFPAWLIHFTVTKEKTRRIIYAVFSDWNPCLLSNEAQNPGKCKDFHQGVPVLRTPISSQFFWGGLPDFLIYKQDFFSLPRKSQARKNRNWLTGSSLFWKKTDAWSPLLSMRTGRDGLHFGHQGFRFGQDAWMRGATYQDGFKWKGPGHGTFWEAVFPTRWAKVYTRFGLVWQLTWMGYA